MKKDASRLAALLLALLTTMSVCTAMAAAQNNMGGQSGAQGNNAEALQKLEKMAAALQLTPAQKQQVRPILMEEAPKLKAIKNDTSLGPLQKAMKLRQIGDATDAKLKPILTAQQYQTWQQMREQERQQMMQKMENR